MRTPGTRILLICLAWLSTWTVVTRVIVPNLQARQLQVATLLDGSIEAPYQYRVLKHWLALGLDTLLRPLVEAPDVRHVLAYGTLTFVTCLGIYGLLYQYLHRCVGQTGALLGSLWLAAILPLSLTGFMMEGDLITLLTYLIILEMLHTRHSAWVPLAVGLGALNREQIGWAITWQALWHVTAKTPRVRAGIELLGSLVAWSLVQGALRIHFGWKENPYTLALHLEHNGEPRAFLLKILPLWTALVLAPAWLAWKGRRTGSPFQRGMLLLVVPYTLMFGGKGNLWELAKFLPALLGLLPPALRTLLEPTPEEPSDATPKSTSID